MIIIAILIAWYLCSWGTFLLFVKLDKENDDPQTQVLCIFWPIMLLIYFMNKLLDFFDNRGKLFYVPKKMRRKK